jgi:membrane protease YdiL (CAAX protease family)
MKAHMQNKHRSVLTFFALVFILSIPFWVLGTLHPIQLLPGLPLSALGAFTPAIAALILLYRSDRFRGVRWLLQRVFDYQRVKNKNWYLAFIFVNPTIAVLAYGIIRAGNQSLPKPAPLTLAIFPLFLIFFIGALGEELGWSGYATKPLQHDWGIILAGLLLGIVWAGFHFIPLLQVHRSIGWIAWWSLGTISLRIIMTWLYVLSGESVFAASIFHATINLCWQLFPIDGSFYDPRVFGLIAFGFAFAISFIAQLSTKAVTNAG